MADFGVCHFCGAEIQEDDDGRGTLGGRRCCGACGEAESAREVRTRFEALCRRHERMRGWDFDTFEHVASDSAGTAALEAAKRWAEFDPETAHWDPGVNVYLWGPVGAGKTGLAWSILRHRMLEWGVRGDFVNVRDVLAVARDSYSDGGEDPLKGLDRVEYLVLDDLGAERPTDWAVETIGTLVDRRYQNIELTTIVTSNYSPSGLIRRLDPRDPIIGQRIVSRLVESCTVVEVAGRDRRLEAA